MKNNEFDFLSRFALVCAAPLMLALFVADARAALVYNFDDGTFQGWTTVATDANQAFAVTSAAFPGPQSGTHYVRSSSFNDRDTAHDTLWIRSPAFAINEAGPLSFALIGGVGTANLPDDEDDIPASSTTTGALGVGLRDAATGEFLLTARSTFNSQTVYELLSFSPAQLAAVNAPGRAFTLDFFDYHHGGWGWVALDSVSIPGYIVPEPSALALFMIGMVLLIGLGCVRRARASQHAKM